MSNTFPLDDGRLVTTRYDKANDEMTLIIETAEGEVLLSVILPMDEARRLADWFLEGYVEDLDITPEKIIRGGNPELN